MVITNFTVEYFAALDALIVALGGVVPTATYPNSKEADLARLDALVAAVGGTVPAVGPSDALRRWRGAITALGGVLPSGWSNEDEALAMHVAAFQSARGIAVPSPSPAPTNLNEYLLTLLTLEP